MSSDFINALSSIKHQDHLIYTTDASSNLPTRYVCLFCHLRYSVEFNENMLSHYMGSQTLECVRTRVYYTICKLLSSGVLFFSESLVDHKIILCRNWMRRKYIEMKNKFLQEHCRVESMLELAKTVFYSSMRPLNSAQCLEQSGV